MAIFKTARKVYRKYKKGGIRKVARYGAKKVYNRYKTGGVSQVIKDVNMLKGMINAEKKRFDFAAGSQVVGQLNGATNGAGHWSLDITPMPAVGVNHNQRTGSSIKLHSSYMQFCFWQQINTHSAMKIRLMIVQSKGTPITSSTLLTQMYLTNHVTGIIDYNSETNPDSFNQFKVLRTKNIFIPADQTGSAVVQKCVKIPHKWMRGKGHHIRWQNDSQTLTQGQIFLVMIADIGNISTTSTASTLHVATNQVSTGMHFNYDVKHYYYDN